MLTIMSEFIQLERGQISERPGAARIEAAQDHRHGGRLQKADVQGKVDARKWNTESDHVDWIAKRLHVSGAAA